MMSVNIDNIGPCSRVLQEASILISERASSSLSNTFDTAFMDNCTRGQNSCMLPALKIYNGVKLVLNQNGS
jgi:hypothetical protein